ncbi:hypothetical protein R3P38DRAFT_3230633 [Favolaschia claudopus]|uniref:Uncharacterized protein n=1 Tax=Favolaschia claudopus TaxID=2862362 RepID=A0AAV9ZMD7_9AGAR
MTTSKHDVPDHSIRKTCIEAPMDENRGRRKEWTFAPRLSRRDDRQATSAMVREPSYGRSASASVIDILAHLGSDQDKAMKDMGLEWQAVTHYARNLAQDTFAHNLISHSSLQQASPPPHPNDEQPAALGDDLPILATAQHQSNSLFLTAFYSNAPAIEPRFHPLTDTPPDQHHAPRILLTSRRFCSTIIRLRVLWRVSQTPVVPHTSLTRSAATRRCMTSLLVFKTRDDKAKQGAAPRSSEKRAPYGRVCGEKMTRRQRQIRRDQMLGSRLMGGSRPPSSPRPKTTFSTIFSTSRVPTLAAENAFLTHDPIFRHYLSSSSSRHGSTTPTPRPLRLHPSVPAPRLTTHPSDRRARCPRPRPFRAYSQAKRESRRLGNTKRVDPGRAPMQDGGADTQVWKDIRTKATRG